MDSFSYNTFKVSALSSPLMPAQHIAELAQRGPFGGVELDLLDSLRFRLQGWQSAPPAVLDAISAIWFPPPLANRLPDKVAKLAEQRTVRGLPVTLIVDQPRRSSRDAIANQMNLAIRLRMQMPEAVRIAIGVRPVQIENTRAHLANLAALRLQASEWDLDIALDLGRELEWLWEAEAALYRIIGSLSLIRLSYPTSTFDGRFRASLTQRTISSCVELGYRGDFSLMVPLPWWHWRNQRSLEAACRDAASRISRQLGSSMLPPETERMSRRLADRA